MRRSIRIFGSALLIAVILASTNPSAHAGRIGGPLSTLAVAPVGKPVADNANAELKPVVTVEVIVVVPESPRAIVIEGDDGDSENVPLMTMSRIG